MKEEKRSEVLPFTKAAGYGVEPIALPKVINNKETICNTIKFSAFPHEILVLDTPF